MIAGLDVYFVLRICFYDALALPSLTHPVNPDKCLAHFVFLSGIFSKAGIVNKAFSSLRQLLLTAETTAKPSDVSRLLNKKKFKNMIWKLLGDYVGITII